MTEREIESTVRYWAPFLDGWARKQAKRWPGMDWEGAASKALLKAVQTYRVNEGKFYTWLRWNLRSQSSILKRGYTTAWRHFGAPDFSKPIDEYSKNTSSYTDLYDALSCISPICAEVLILHYIDGVSLRQIARDRDLHHFVIECVAKEGMKELRKIYGLEHVTNNDRRPKRGADKSTRKTSSPLVTQRGRANWGYVNGTQAQAG